MRRRAERRGVAMPLDLDEILGEPKQPQKPKATSVRLPLEMVAKLDRISKERRMSRNKLIKSVLAALIKDYEDRHDIKRR